jgi:hypothetical protein
MKEKRLGGSLVARLYKMEMPATPSTCLLFYVSVQEQSADKYEEVSAGESNRRLGKKCTMRSFIICTAHQNIMPVIKSRTMRLAGNVAHMGKITVITQIQDKVFSLNV